MNVSRILLVDDHPMMNEGLSQTIATESRLSVCGTAGNVQEALMLVESARPDLVITDLNLPGRNGLELIKDLGATHPEIPVLVFSMHDELLYAERVLRAGGRGYISKNTPKKELIQAILTVLGGEIFASPAITKHFLQTLSRGSDQAKTGFPLKSLTDRELEIYELIGQAKGTQEISSLLGISTRTVDVHRMHIRQKLGLEDGSTLTRHAIRHVEVGLTE